MKALVSVFASNEVVLVPALRLVLENTVRASGGNAPWATTFIGNLQNTEAIYSFLAFFLRSDTKVGFKLSQGTNKH
jgi:hypothetical protein